MAEQPTTTAPAPAAVDEWLRAYGAAWAAHDGAAAAAIFTDDAAYHWGPFEPPLRGTDAIRARWEQATADQGEVRFEAEPLARDGARVVARWRVEMAGPDVALDGIFVLDFAADGRCARLQERWMNVP